MNLQDMLNTNVNTVQVNNVVASTNPATQPANQQASSFYPQDTSNITVDKKKLIADVFSYTSNLMKNADVDTSLAHYSNTQEGGFTGKVYLDAAREKPSLIGMNEKDVEDNPIIAVRNVLGRNIAEVAIDKYLEVWNQTKDIAKADESARMFINDNVNGLASYRPDVKDKSAFNDTFSRFAAEDFTKQTLGYRDTQSDKLYITTMSQGMNSGLKEDAIISNFSKTAFASALGTEGLVEGVGSMMGFEWASQFRDQQKNQLVQDEIKTKDIAGVTSGEIVGTALGIGAIIGEAYVTGGISSAMSATKTGATIARYAPQLLRGQVQDTLDNDALAKKYFDGNALQNPDYSAMIASRTFDVVTAIGGDVLSAYAKGFVAQGGLKTLYKKTVDEPLQVSGAKLAANLSVWRGLKAATTDVGVEAAVDLIAHNTLAYALDDKVTGDKFFTEGQNISLGLENFDPQMSARYIGTKVFSRLFGGSMARIRQLKADKQSQLVGKDYMIDDTNRDSALKGWQRIVKSFGDILEEDVLATEDMNIRARTSADGSRPIGLREIFTDPTKDKDTGLTKGQTFEKQFGKNAIVNRYVANALGNNVFFSMFTNNKLNTNEEYIEAYNAPDSDYEIAKTVTDMGGESRTMDFSIRNMNKKSDALSDEEKNSAANIVVNKFIPANATPEQFDKGIDNIASFILNKNVVDTSSSKERGEVTFYERLLTVLQQRQREAGDNYDNVEPENIQKNRTAYKNSFDRFNEVFTTVKVSEAANSEYVKKLQRNMDDDYRKNEYDVRQELSKTFDIQDVNADYMKKVYDSRGDLSKRLNEMYNSRTSPNDKGTTHDFYKRLATTFMSKEGYDNLNEVNRDLALEIGNMKEEPKGADDFIKLDNMMKKAGEQLVEKEFNKIFTIANASTVSDNDKSLSLGASARRIRQLSSIFGYKLMPAIDSGYEKLTTGTIAKVNTAFQKANWLGNAELKNILANEFKSMDMTNEELQKNAFQTFYSSLVTVSQKAFFEQKALTDAFKSPDVSRALHYAMYNRYTSPGSLNTKLASQLSNMVLNVNNPAFTMLHERDNKTLIAMGYLNRMFSIYKNSFTPNAQQKKDFANAIVNKSLGRYMVFEAPEKVFESDPDVDNIVTKAKLYIKGETGLDVNDSSLTNILNAYLHKDSTVTDLSNDFDNLLDHVKLGDDPDVGLLARAASTVIMGDNRRISKEIWESSADNEHIDYNSVFIVKSFDSDESRTMNFVEVLNELTAKDSSGVNHVRLIQTMVNVAKSKDEALSNVTNYLKSVLPSLGIDVIKTANSKDGKADDDAITRIAHNIIHDTFNKTHVELSVNVNAHQKASQFVMSMTNTGVKQNIFKGAYIVNMNTDEYNDLDKIPLNTLERMGFLRVGQSGTGGSPLFIVIPGIDFSDKKNLLKVIKEFGIDSRLESAFDGYDKKIFNPLKNLHDGASEDSIVEAFNKVKKDLSESLKEKLTASAKELEAFDGITTAKLSGKVEYNYDLARDVNAKQITAMVDRLAVITDGDIANNVKEVIGIAGVADRNQPSGNALNLLASNVDKIMAEGRLDNFMDMATIKEKINNQIIAFNTSMVMSQRSGVEAKDSRLASNLIQQYQKFFEYESVNWLSKQDANDLPKQIYDKITKQIKAIDIKENDLKVKTTSDVLSQSVELLLFHEMFFTATDLQKRTSVGITASNPESARLVSGYDSAVAETKARTGREPRIVIVNGDYKSVAGALWFPKWVQDYYSTLSNNTDGNKLAIATDGSLMKLMVDPLANFRKILGDNEIMDSNGNRMSNADIDDNDIVINFETWKSIGTGLLKALPSVKVVGTDNKGRAIVLKDAIDGKNVYKNFILNQLHIHSNIKDTANDTNAADQMMAADRAMGNYMAKITNSSVDKQVAKAESVLGMADIGTDTEGAYKAVHSAITRTEKITGANPPVRIRTGAINNEIGAVLNKPISFGFNKELDSQITATQVGLRLPTMLQMLTKTKAYTDREDVRKLHKQLTDTRIGNDLANHQDLVRRALDVLSEGEQPLLGKIGKGNDATYFMFGVRFPAQNQGSATMHHLSYVANAKFGEGVEMDPFYMPMLNKADSDGDKFVVYPADVKAYYESVNDEFKMTQGGWNDEANVEDQKLAMVKAMSTHLSDSLTKLMPIDDASIKALRVSDYLKSRDMNMELGLIVKLSTDNSIWFDAEYDAMNKAISSVGLTLGNKIKEILFANRSESVVLDKVPEFNVTHLDTLKKIKKDNNWVLLRKQAGDNPPQGIGSMVGSLLPKKHLIFGGVAYKILVTTQGDQQGSRQTVYLLKSDSDDGDFNQTDFGMNAAIGFDIPNTGVNIPLMERLKSFNHSEQMALADQIYARLSMTAKNDQVKSLEDLIYTSYNTAGVQISNNNTQFRITSADRGYTEGQNTGTDAQKYQGLAHLYTMYRGRLLEIFDEVNMSILGSRAVLISKLSAGGKATIGNLTSNFKQEAIDELDSANVVKLIIHAMDKNANVSRADFKSIKKIQSGKKFMELPELQASINAVRNARLNNVDDATIGKRYGHMFRTSYRILKMLSNKQLGLGLVNGQLKDFDKTYLGGVVDETTSELYINELPTVVPINDDKGNPVDIIPLEVHTKFNGMATAVAAVYGATRYDARMTVMMALNSVHLPSTVSIDTKVDQEGLRDALVNKVYEAILANGKGSLVTKDNVVTYLTDALSNHDIELSKAVVSGADSMGKLMDSVGVHVDFKTRLANSPSMIKKLRESYDAEKKTVVRLTKQGKPVSAGDLVDHLNGLLSEKQSSKLKAGDSFVTRNEVFEALLGTLGSETQNAAWLRKQGFNNAVSKKTIDFFGKTLAVDTGITTDYKFDMEIALDLKNVAFTEFNMDLRYMPEALNKLYQTTADPCNF